MEWAWIVILILSIPVTAITALIMALLQRGRIASLEVRIAELEARPAARIDIQAARTPEKPSDTEATPPAAPLETRHDDASIASDVPEEPSPTADEPNHEAADKEPSSEPTASARDTTWDTATGSADWTRDRDEASDNTTAWSASQHPDSPANARTDADFEARLGSRWAVIVGGITLALGGVFLVRYSIEAGLLGPAARIVLGAVFSIVLLVAGEALRRRSPNAALAGIKAISIPSVLTAAGTSSLFATIFAAHALYGFVGPTLAFVLLGVIAIATMLLSALHGRGLAALGLVGAYTAPLLVSTDEPSAAGLFLYLGFITFSGFGLARLMGWRWLAITTSCFALAWGFLVVVFDVIDFDTLVLGSYAATVMALAVVFLIVDVHRGEDNETARPDVFALIVVGAVAILVLATNAAADHHVVTLGVSLLTVGAMVWCSSRFRSVAGLAIGGALLSVLVMTGFDVPVDALDPVGALAPAGPLGIAGVIPERVTAFSLWATLFAALLLAGHLGLGLRSPSRDDLALASGLGPVLLLAAAYWRIADFQPTPIFIGLALLVAVTNALQTEIAMRRSTGTPADTRAISFAATGSVAGLCLGLTMLFETGWLTVSLALLAAAIAWLASVRSIAGLGPLAIAVAIIVIARTAYDPLLVRAGIGTTPIWNWLLWAYGVPALAFGYAAATFRKLAAPIAANTFEALATVYVALLLALQIHHLASGGRILDDPALGTIGAWIALSIAIAVVMQVRSWSGGTVITHWLGKAFLWLGLAGAAGIFVINPWTSGGEVGGNPAVGELIAAYLAPALAFMAYALMTRGRDQRQSAIVGIAAMVMTFAWITLTVRSVFTGFLSYSDPAGAELYTYSAAWLVYGIALLAAGLVMHIRMLRLASAAIIVLAVLKAFLIDMAELEGVLRALSFIGLGAVLIAIGLVYQRLLIGRQPVTAE